MASKLPALESGSNYVNPHCPARRVRQLQSGELPEPGAHLLTPWMGFAHHGLYVGDGNVVHYGALLYDILRRPVEEVSLAIFAGGRAVFVVEHGDACLATDEVIRRARSRLGEDRYRLFTNNCEHFVEWCLHGVARSFQAETALAFPRLLGERIEGAMLRFARRMFAMLIPARAVVRRDPRDRG